MAKTTLTDDIIQALPSPAKGQAEIRDGEVTGFGVRVTPAGRKTFFFKYRYQGKNHRLRLGLYPAVSLADARVAAQAARNELSRGLDPQREQRDAIAYSETFSSALSDFIAHHPAPKGESWTKERERILRNEFEPVLGPKRLRDIVAADIAVILDRRLETGRKANRADQSIKTFFMWCVEQQKITGSPVAGRPKPDNQEKRNRKVAVEIKIVTPAAEDRTWL